MTLRASLLLLLALIALGNIAPGVARADETKEEPVGELTRDPVPDAAEARRFVQRGQEMYSARKYSAAAAAFARAYQLGGPESLLFNLAQAHRLAGSCAPARRAYARFLQEVPAARNRAVAERHHRNLESCARRADAEGVPVPPPSAPLPAETTTDGPSTSAAASGKPSAAPPAAAPGPTPSAAPSAAPPLKLVVAPLAAPPAAPPIEPSAPPPAASAPPSVVPAQKLFPAPAGEGTAGETTPAPPNSPERAPRRSMALRNFGLVATGLGVSALVTGLVLRSGESDPDPTNDDDDDDSDSGQALSSPLIVAGGITTAVGIGLTIWGQARGRSSATALLPLRGGALVARAWQF